MPMVMPSQPLSNPNPSKSSLPIPPSQSSTHPPKPRSQFSPLKILITISTIITYHLCKLNGLLFPMICLKSACLIPLTQKGTARSGVEKWWIVLKKKKKKITSATAWWKDHWFMFIAFWDSCNSNGSNFVYAASCLLATTRGVRG